METWIAGCSRERGFISIQSQLDLEAKPKARVGVSTSTPPKAVDRRRDTSGFLVGFVWEEFENAVIFKIYFFLNNEG